MNEIAPFLDQKARAVQSLLVEARARLRTALAVEPLGSLDFTNSDASSHHKAQTLVETADDLITDEDSRWLEGHLKGCDRCQAFALQMVNFENELRTALHHRWDSQPVSAVNLVSLVIDRRRTRTSGRKAANLVGALIIGLAAIAVVVFLPAIAPPETLPLLAAVIPTPTMTAGDHLPSSIALPLATSSPAINPLPRSTILPTRSPLASNPALIRRIYPGKLSYVALRSNNNALMTMLPDGSYMHPFETGFLDNSNPVWSPDGSQLAFLASSNEMGQNQVVVINADGSNQHLVSRSDLQAYPTPYPPQTSFLYPRILYSYGPPHWSPDGKQLAVSLQYSYTVSFLAMLAADGSETSYLPVEGLDRSLVEWSPDGRTIAYIAKNGEELWEWEPDQPEAKGINPRQMRSDTRWDSAYGLSWSPDSKQVALMVGNQNNESIEENLRIFPRLGDRRS